MTSQVDNGERLEREKQKAVLKKIAIRGAIAKNILFIFSCANMDIRSPIALLRGNRSPTQLAHRKMAKTVYWQWQNNGASRFYVYRLIKY